MRKLKYENGISADRIASAIGEIIGGGTREPEGPGPPLLFQGGLEGP